MKKISIFIFIFLTARIFPFKFEFNDKKNDRYIITTHTIQTLLINNREILKIDMRHKGELLVVNKNRDKALIQGKYDYYQRPIGDAGPYRAKNTRSYKTRFTRIPRGKIKVEEEFYYPVVRNVPSFPNKDIKIGQTWEKYGIESQDFRKRGLKDPYKYKIRVFYRYVKDTKKNNQELAVIEFFYYVNQRTENPIIYGSRNGFIPSRFFGFVKGKYYWNKHRGFASFYESEYDFIFVNRNGTTNEYKGTDNGKIIKIRKITKKEEKDIETKIRESVNKSKIPVEITKDKRGLKLNFKGKVLFKFSSYKLTGKALTQLKDVAKVLKTLQQKYPGIEFRVEGHADALGTKKRKQFFSDKRAKEVAKFLIKNGVNPNKISFRGFADKKPIAPNATKQGRSKNRRVEIIVETK